MIDSSKIMLSKDVLKDKVIVITGGGTGLGKSMAQCFSSLGAKISIWGRRLEIIENTAKEIENTSGNRVLAVQCDIRNYNEVENALNKVIEEFGYTTSLVNNAAGNFVSPTERLSNRAFDIILDIVLKGSKNCILAFGNYWIKNKKTGNVLSITTTYASTGSGYVVPSAAAKAGVLAISKSLAVEWAKYNIRFNTISPGAFPTKGAWDRLFPQELSNKIDFVKKIPLGRVGEHHELANLASYLISDYSAFMNGEEIIIDGGEWLKGAGEFNFLDMIKPDEWDEIEKSVRKAKS
ncbi:MAG: SDR family oxidoreductase [Bacteroidia bacterium]|nr:SDR family oxidoreductase [Bacteroidia bacterium]